LIEQRNGIPEASSAGYYSYYCILNIEEWLWNYTYTYSCILNYDGTIKEYCVWTCVYRQSLISFQILHGHPDQNVKKYIPIYHEIHKQFHNQ
jgi:hypothetical protein